MDPSRDTRGAASRFHADGIGVATVQVRPQCTHLRAPTRHQALAAAARPIAPLQPANDCELRLNVPFTLGGSIDFVVPFRRQRPCLNKQVEVTSDYVTHALPFCRCRKRNTLTPSAPACTYGTGS